MIDARRKSPDRFRARSKTLPALIDTLRVHGYLALRDFSLLPSFLPIAHDSYSNPNFSFDAPEYSESIRVTHVGLDLSHLDRSVAEVRETGLKMIGFRATLSILRDPSSNGRE